MKLKNLSKFFSLFSVCLLSCVFCFSNTNKTREVGASLVAPTDYDIFYPSIKFSSTISNNFVYGFNTTGETVYYDTNEVNSLSDLVDGNIYKLDLYTLYNLVLNNVDFNNKFTIYSLYLKGMSEKIGDNGAFLGYEMKDFTISQISDLWFRFIISENYVNGDELPFVFINSFDGTYLFGAYDIDFLNSYFYFIYNDDFIINNNNYIGSILPLENIVKIEGYEIDNYKYLSVVTVTDYELDLYIKSESYNSGIVESWCIKVKDYTCTSSIYEYSSDYNDGVLQNVYIPIVTGIVDRRNHYLWDITKDYYYKEDFYTGNYYSYLSVDYVGNFLFRYLSTDALMPNFVVGAPLVNLNNRFSSILSEYDGALQFMNTTNPYVLNGGVYQFVTPFGYEFTTFVDSLYSNFGANTTNYDEGYRFGYSVGLTEGNNSGYNLGYKEGYDYASNEDIVISTIFNGILQVGLLPINFFLSIFNFEILGINLTSFVTALLSIAITIYVWRLIKGGKND